MRVLVEAEAGSLDFLEQRLDQRLVGERLQVREMRRSARAARTSEGISSIASSRPSPSLRTCRTIGFPYSAATSATATARRCRRVARPGGVDEAEREVRRAGLEARPHLPPHLLQLVRRRRPALATDHRVSRAAPWPIEGTSEIAGRVSSRAAR